MAIPQVDISTRRLETSPSLHYLPSQAGEQGRAVGGAITDAANGLNRIVEVKRRADEREAEYAVLQADNFVRNGWLGTDAQDPTTGEWKHTPGVADRNWEQMRDDKTTSLDEMKKLQDAVREQKFYADLSPEQRKVFERKWIFKADEHSRTAQQHHQRLSLARIQDETKRTIEMRGAEVGRVYAADDLTYTKVAGRNALLNWGDLQGTALNEESRAMLDDPRCNFDDIARSQGWDDKTRKLKFEEYKKVALGFDVNRITAFQQAAASGQYFGGHSPEECADIADQLTASLNGSRFGLRPDGTKKGTGWLGTIKLTNGSVMSEMSVKDAEDDGADAVKDADGNFIDYPMLVPGLSKDEIEIVGRAASGDKDVTKTEEWGAVVEKARAHAKKQIAAGKSVWANSGTGEPMISDAEANAIRAETRKARLGGQMVTSKRHHDNAVKMEGELDKFLWKMAPKSIDGKVDPNNILSVQLPDENEYRKQLQAAIDRDEISETNAVELMTKLEKMHKDQREVFDDVSHPERFAKKTDKNELLRLKMLIVDRERNGDSVESVSASVEGAKASLTQEDYFSLWNDCRKERDKEDDRITSKVFADFLHIDEFTEGIALDPSKRRTSAGESAVSTLLGSSEAEYERKGRINNPDFTIDDVDAACREVRQYLKEHPGDESGAYQHLETLVRPKSEKARAAAFRDRIKQMIKRRVGKTGASRIWNVDQAFDEAGSVAPAPASVPQVETRPGKVESRRPTRRHN